MGILSTNLLRVKALINFEKFLSAISLTKKKKKITLLSEMKRVAPLSWNWLITPLLLSSSSVFFIARSICGTFSGIFRSDNATFILRKLLLLIKMLIPDIVRTIILLPSRVLICGPHYTDHMIPILHYLSYRSRIRHLFKIPS